MTFDYSLEESTGTIRAHRPDCREVRALADIGGAVVSLMGCKAPLPADFPRHECLDEEAGPELPTVIEGDHRTHVAS